MLFQHNESISIYSHLIPALLFLLAQAIVHPIFSARYPDATVGDQVVFAVFMITATICLGVSAGYHTLLNHSKRVSELSLRCDFVGIVILIIGFFISGVSVGFYCDQKLRWIYWGMVRPFMPLRTLMRFETDNSDLGSRDSDNIDSHSSTVPGTTLSRFPSCCLYWNRIHWICAHHPWLCNLRLGCHDQRVRCAILFWRRSLACSRSYLLCCECFPNSLVLHIPPRYLDSEGDTNGTQLRIPEVYIPGKFDIYGASHQICKSPGS